MPKFFYFFLFVWLVAGVAYAHDGVATDTAVFKEPYKEPQTQTHNLTHIPVTPTTPNSLVNEPKSSEVPVLSSEELLDNPELLEHALYSSIVLGNVPAIKNLLPIYKKLPHQDDKARQLLIDMSKASLAQAEGDNKTAIKQYREVLADFPKLNDVRLTLARLLVDDKQNEAGKDQFVRLRSENALTDEQRAIVEAYIEHLNRQSKWSIGGGLGYAYDPNVGNAPDERVIPMNGGVWTFEEAEKAHGVSFGLSASRDFNIKGNYYAKVNGSINGKTYWTNHDHDDLMARLDAGLAYKNARTEWAVLPYHQKRHFGGEKYTQEAGVRGEYSRWFAPRHQVLSAVEWGHESYERNANLSGEMVGGSLTWLYLANARQYFSLGADYSYKDAHDKSRAYDRYGVRASWTREWDKGISTQFGLDVGKRAYGGDDLFGITRKEMEYTGRLSVWHRGVHFWGITPRLTMTYRKTDGNHPVYEYTKGNAFIQFNKTF